AGVDQRGEALAQVEQDRGHILVHLGERLGGAALVEGGHGLHGARVERRDAGVVEVGAALGDREKLAVGRWVKHRWFLFYRVLRITCYVRRSLSDYWLLATALETVTAAMIPHEATKAELLGSPPF